MISFATMKKINNINYDNLVSIQLPYSKKYDIEDNFCGLYFIGGIYADPDDNHYYLVKIGSGKDVQKRVNQYFGYNPLIYNGYNTIKTTESVLRAAESNCQAYIGQWAIGIASGTQEWYHVTKDVYFLLCRMFNDTTLFEMIANGEVGQAI